MIFNSQIFLFLFLPASLLLYDRFSQHLNLRKIILIIASILFYAYWDMRFVPLLLGSVCFNWLLAKLIDEGKKTQLVIGVIFNLALIGIFKYFDFFAGIIGAFTDIPAAQFNIILPLGISFFTFQQISYLVDHYQGKVPNYGFLDYTLYVIFFPQLIAGPIVRHHQFIFQIGQKQEYSVKYENLSRGAILLIVGLIKKVLLADQLALLANPLFENLHNIGLSFIESWIAILCFTGQIYFDFSGYSDMAIGIALMFGFMLPVNFNAPYSAISIQDFWRRWHITLSEFLRDYLYIPLGGNRSGAIMQIRNIMITMLLGGLWHGAGWNFVLWGGLHGFAIATHMVWQKCGLKMDKQLAWGLTFFFVIIAWVPFRIEDFADVLSFYKHLITFDSLSGITQKASILISIAFIVAIFGPTSQSICLEKQYGYRWLAPIAALSFVLLVIEVGSVHTQDFIYFQF